jgi:hypothetical protein
MAASSASILRPLFNFNAQNTLPELQNNFLVLWNEIGPDPKDRVLKEIRFDLSNLHHALRSAPTTLPDASPSNILTVERRPTTAVVPSHSTPLGSRGRYVASQTVDHSRLLPINLPTLPRPPGFDQPALSFTTPEGPSILPPQITGAATPHRASRRPRHERSK